MWRVRRANTVISLCDGLDHPQLPCCRRDAQDLRLPRVSLPPGPVGPFPAPSGPVDVVSGETHAPRHGQPPIHVVFLPAIPVGGAEQHAATAHRWWCRCPRRDCPGWLPAAAAWPVRAFPGVDSRTDKAGRLRPGTSPGCGRSALSSGPRQRPRLAPAPAADNGPAPPGGCFQQLTCPRCLLIIALMAPATFFGRATPLARTG